MLRILIAVFVLGAAASVLAAQFQYGTAEKKGYAHRAVAAVKQDKAKALDMFNEGEGGGGRLLWSEWNSRQFIRQQKP